MKLLKDEDKLLKYVTEVTRKDKKSFQELQKQKYRTEIENLTKRIKELENLIQRLFESKVSADIPDAVFHKMMTNYRKELEEKEENLSEINNKLNNYIEETDPLKDSIEFINKLKQIDETNIKREDILNIIKNVTVHKIDRYKRILEINYYKVKYLVEGYFNE